MRVIFCDICNRKIEDADDDMVRILVGMGEDGPEYLVFGFEDDEGEAVDRHHCLSCLKNFLDGLNPVDLRRMAEQISEGGDPEDSDDPEGPEKPGKGGKNNKKGG